MLKKTISALIGFSLAGLLAACAQLPGAVSPQSPDTHSADPPTKERAETPGRRALLVGIDDYSASQLRRDADAEKSSRSSWPSLAGAVNDVESIREVLQASFAFRDQDILVLTDQEATRETILETIEKHLIEPTRKDDQVVFYYSGHGSQVRNSKSDERDLLDESIVPADAPLGVPDIRDKELRRQFNKILAREARLVVVLDSCHSGSGARRGLPSGARPRGLETDLRDVADGSDYGPRPEEEGALVLSAAQDDEWAWEMTTEDDGTHGAFTWALLQAMRAAAKDESAERVFLRVRAWLRSANKYQEPVLAGLPKVRRIPLFGGRADQPDGRTVVMAESVGRDGTVVLRGGWANGLGVGSELVKLSDKEPEARRELRLEVTAIQGLGRSTARIIDRESGAPNALLTQRVRSGDLFEIVSWVVPRGSPLRVWIPRISETTVARQLAQKLLELADEGRFGWVDDPVQKNPSHVLRWHRGQWQLIVAGKGDGGPRLLGTAPVPSTVSSLLSEEAQLFVHLPAPTNLVERIEIGPGTDHAAVEPTENPALADYQLVGRLYDDAIEYGWIRPETDAADGRRSGMPSRSAWRRLENQEISDAAPVELDSTAGQLERHVLKLAKIRDWHKLTSPPNQEFPYRFHLRDEENQRLVDNRELREGHQYTIVLTLSDNMDGADVRDRYVYAFSIDSAGNSVLLYPPPPWGNIENRFPHPHPLSTGATTGRSHRPGEGSHRPALAVPGTATRAKRASCGFPPLPGERERVGEGVRG